MGSAADADGRFEILSLDSGRHELVVSMVGYATVVRSIRFDGAVVDVGLIKLEPVRFEVEELVVSSERPRDWDRNFERFEREFLGTSGHAGETEILNPYVLDFQVEGSTNTLRATASQPLVVVNEALGYRVTFVLQDFAVSSWSYSIRFKVQPRFEKLIPDSDEQATRWAQARVRAYRGSFHHFLYSLARDQLFESGFALLVGSDIAATEDDMRMMPHAVPDSLLAPGLVSYERQFFSAEPLHVLYWDESESNRYAAFVRDVTGRQYRPNRAQHSVLAFDQAVTLHTSGYLYNPYDVQTYGYWIWERAADMLPRDYIPPERVVPADSVVR